MTLNLQVYISLARFSVCYNIANVINCRCLLFDVLIAESQQVSAT